MFPEDLVRNRGRCHAQKDGIAASLKARIDHLLQLSVQPFRNGALAESLDHPRHITAVLREHASDDRRIRQAYALARVLCQNGLASTSQITPTSNTTGTSLNSRNARPLGRLRP